MDYTQGEEGFKRARAKKQMLWFGIISLSMTFAGLTSAYIVSMERRDWDSTYQFPEALIWSTIVIIISSITMIAAKKAIVGGNRSLGTMMLAATLVLGLLFVYFQGLGYGQLKSVGLYFTGQTSNITGTFISLIGALHVAHVVAGFIALVRVIISHLKGKYTAQNHLGLTLGATFWHFLDIMWIFLFLLFYCTRYWCEWFTCA